MKYLRFLFAVILIPFVFVLSIEFLNLVTYLGKNVSRNTITFWLGLASYFIFQQIFFKPIRTYIFGHELTHAIVGILSGARLKSFKVTSRGGSVKLTKTNVWITLAPYFVPIYTIIIVFIYWVCGQFWQVSPFYPYLLFLVGFTLSFHFSLTHYALVQGQTDIKQFGAFFSSVFIIVINCIILASLLKLLFPDQINLKRYLVSSINSTFLFWKLLYVKGREIWASFL
ncbi:MAG: hypothetical protein JW871_02445 [Endomicrobiales bacterium]|nr:hypothetical protein [Endomicrobiales bacterium]